MDVLTVGAIVNVVVTQEFAHVMDMLQDAQENVVANLHVIVIVLYAVVIKIHVLV